MASANSTNRLCSLVSMIGTGSGARPSGGAPSGTASPEGARAEVGSGRGCSTAPGRWGVVGLWVAAAAVGGCGGWFRLVAWVVHDLGLVPGGWALLGPVQLEFRCRWGDGLVVEGGDAAPVFELVEAALHHVAALVALSVEDRRASARRAGAGPVAGLVGALGDRPAVSPCCSPCRPPGEQGACGAAPVPGAARRSGPSARHQPHRCRRSAARPHRHQRPQRPCPRAASRLEHAWRGRRFPARDRPGTRRADRARPRPGGAATAAACRHPAG